MATPSNLGAFSPELKTFIITKYDPLLSIVNELNERLQDLEKSRHKLEKRVAAVESKCRSLSNPAAGGAAEAAATTPTNSAAPRRVKEESLTAPWLFSVCAGAPSSAVQAYLEFSSFNVQELDCRNWQREEDMWVALLDEMPLPESFPPIEYGNTLPSMLRAARLGLEQLCKEEYLLILRSVPGRREATQDGHTITLVAMLAATLSESWQNVGSTAPNELGRIAMVLEGDEVGSRLRAGDKRFQIEPLPDM